MQYGKIKDIGKVVLPAGDLLSKKTLEVMKTVSEAVGNTLGPAGRPVLVERQETGIPSFVTKDGVTVFRALGFDDPVKQEIMATAREASARTASEAGDGTTTATVLAEAIVRLTHDFCKENPSIYPQRVVRKLEEAFKEVIEPTIKSISKKVNFSSETERKLLHAVAKVSANGDTELANAVLECFDLVGDDGNVTLYEYSGPSKYEVEQVNGYTIEMGYEQSCDRFYSLFINDSANQRVRLEKTQFLLYHGQLNELVRIGNLIDDFGNRWKQNPDQPRNLVIVAQRFSEEVLGMLAANFRMPESFKVFPLLIPTSPIPSAAMQFLEDLSAVTTATVFNPISNPLDNARLDDLGYPVDAFESYRSRSTIVVEEDQKDLSELTPEEQVIRDVRENRLLDRVDDLSVQIEQAESRLDRMLLEERLAKITGGIAKLKIFAPSVGDQREKRDRAEDAVMSVRGALKHGALPAGGWAIYNAIKRLQGAYSDDPVINGILIPALEEPVKRLLRNAGINDEDSANIRKQLVEEVAKDSTVIYDVWNNEFVDALEEGLLDSVPAVLEAIRNSISIAGLLGTLGAAVVYMRDHALDRQEAIANERFVRTANADYADY